MTKIRKNEKEKKSKIHSKCYQNGVFINITQVINTHNVITMLKTCGINPALMLKKINIIILILMLQIGIRKE